MRLSASLGPSGPVPVGAGDTALLQPPEPPTSNPPRLPSLCCRQGPPAPGVGEDVRADDDGFDQPAHGLGRTPGRGPQAPTSARARSRWRGCRVHHVLLG